MTYARTSQRLREEGEGGGQNSPGPGFKVPGPLWATPLIDFLSAFDNYTSLRAQIVIANVPKGFILALFRHALLYSGRFSEWFQRINKEIIIINNLLFLKVRRCPGREGPVLRFAPGPGLALAGSGLPWNFPSVKATNILFSPHHTTPCLYVKIYFGVLHKYSEHKNSEDVMTSDTRWVSKPPHLSGRSVQITSNSVCR